MKLQPKLLAAIYFGLMLPTLSSCNTSTETEGTEQPDQDSAALAVTDSVPGPDSLCLPGCGLEATDTQKTGIIPDGYDCPICGMG